MKKKLRWIPAALWMGVIFGMSAQNGTSSGSLSGSVARFAAKLIRGVFPFMPPVDTLTGILHPAVRKGAHMAEYAILFLLLYYLFFTAGRELHAAACASLISFLYACSDELHQRLVAGRAGQFLDVCVDSTGVFIALTAVLFVLARKIEKEPDTVSHAKEKQST